MSDSWSLFHLLFPLCYVKPRERKGRVGSGCAEAVEEWEKLWEAWHLWSIARSTGEGACPYEGVGLVRARVCGVGHWFAGGGAPATQALAPLERSGEARTCGVTKRVLGIA